MIRARIGGGVEIMSQPHRYLITIHISFPHFISPQFGEGGSTTSKKMDITKFVVSRRNRALQRGDHGDYHAQLSRRLVKVRRKLRRTLARKRRYVGKLSAVSAADLGSNHEWVDPRLSRDDDDDDDDDDDHHHHHSNMG